MASIKISVKKDAYDIAMNFFGVLKNLDWNEKEERMKDLRRSFDAS